MNEGAFHFVEALHFVLQDQSDVVRLFHGHRCGHHNLHLRQTAAAESNLPQVQDCVAANGLRH